MSNYPNGFGIEGLSVRDLNILQTHSGRVFYVNNSTAIAKGAVGGSNGNDGSYHRPFATIDYAIGQCAASRGDIILVMPKHAETLATASAIAMDVVGVSVIGLGQGANRPTLTLSATDSTIAISAASCRLSNVIIAPSIDSVVSAIVCSAADCSIDVESRDATSAIELVSGLLTTAAADRLNVKWKHRGFLAGDAGVSFIQLIGVNGANIDMDYYGKSSTVVVEMLTTACDNIEISGFFHNGTTALTKNVVDTVTGSKWIAQGFDGVGGYRFVGGSGAALASLTSASTVGLGTDGTTVTDSATTVLGAIGANNANNAFSSASVVANADGSVLERLEAIMDPTGAYVPGLGYRVTKTSNLADGSGTDNLFTVTGSCLVNLIVGEVTTVVGGAATMKLRDTTNSIDLCAATTVDTDAAGTMYLFSGVASETLNSSITPVIGVAYKTTGGTTPVVLGKGGGTSTISHVLDAADTGAVLWTLYYLPITSGAGIVAAA